MADDHMTKVPIFPAFSASPLPSNREIMLPPPMPSNILFTQFSICHDLFLMQLHAIDHFCILRVLVSAKQSHALIQCADLLHLFLC